MFQTLELFKKKDENDDINNPLVIIAIILFSIAIIMSLYAFYYISTKRGVGFNKSK